MKFSPLFWPVELKANTIHILDETRLPQRLSYIKIKNYQQACTAIREMKTRAVGQVILAFYVFLLTARRHKEKKALLTALKNAAQAINATRPTLPFKFISDMVLGWANAGLDLEKSINDFLTALKNKRIRQAEATAELLDSQEIILTHCNVSGLMPLIAELCRRQQKEVRFFVTETRPYLQGWRLTAWELQLFGFNVTLITDSMAAQVMSEGKITKVIVGADHLAQNGDIANKIGTYQIAILAQYFEIPFYVLCPPTSKAESGQDIKIEVRPDTEMLNLRGIPLAPKGIKGYYPAFDITPHDLITKHIYLEL